MTMETMGQRFRAAREKKKMNLSKAAALTRIKIQHLEMMENDDFSKMPAPTYAKGFIRIYSQFLGLDPAPLVQEYVDRHLNAGEEEKRPSRTPPRPAPARREAPVAKEADEDTRDTGEQTTDSTRTPTRTSWNPGARLQRIALAVLPLLPRLVIAGVIVLLLVGIVRCTASMTSKSNRDESTSGEMDHSAIMKEPPVRYLDLPASEEPKP